MEELSIKWSHLLMVVQLISYRTDLEPGSLHSLCSLLKEIVLYFMHQCLLRTFSLTFTKIVFTCCMLFGT